MIQATSGHSLNRWAVTSLTVLWWALLYRLSCHITHSTLMSSAVQVELSHHSQYSDELWCTGWAVTSLTVFWSADFVSWFPFTVWNNISCHSYRIAPRSVWPIHQTSVSQACNLLFIQDAFHRYLSLVSHVVPGLGNSADSVRGAGSVFRKRCVNI